MEPQDNIHSVHLGVNEVAEERNGAKTWIILQNVNGRQEEEDELGCPVSGATAAKGESSKEEMRDEAVGHIPAGEVAFVDGRNHNGGHSSNGQEKDQQEDPIPGGTKGPQAVPHPPCQLPRLRYRFTQFQRQELERVFEHNHYPSAAARREIARWIDATESRVQNWFKSRRAKYRKCLRM